LSHGRQSEYVGGSHQRIIGCTAVYSPGSSDLPLILCFTTAYLVVLVMAGMDRDGVCNRI
jgi:hypothetical protein